MDINGVGFPLLSIVIFLPLLGALVALFLGERRQAVKVWALAVSLADLALAALLWALFDYSRPGLQFADGLAWIEPLGVRYSVGVDGISLWLVLLTAALGLVAAAASWRFLNSRPAGEARPYTFLLLALQSAALGVFCAADLVLFFIFWEAMLVPAYLLIARWGGAGPRLHAGEPHPAMSKRRADARPAREPSSTPTARSLAEAGPGREAAAQKAALKFLLYTMAGSALMLVAILALAVLNYNDTGVLTFEIAALYVHPLQSAAQLWLGLAFLLAFAVKAPIWPFHSWLPGAYVQAPAPVTILLAGVLSKMGIYGLIRLCLPLFPSAVQSARPWIWPLAIAGIVYGSLAALVQRDMKRLVAFSSLAHVGLIFAGALAANTEGVQGALLQSVSHGLTVAALFFLVDMLEARRGTRQVESFGGLWQSVPLLGSLFLTALLASIALPGLSAFPGEFALLTGLFQHSPAATAFAVLGLILGAWALLNLFRHAFAGPLAHPENRSLADLRRREAAVLLPLLGLIFAIGILPNLILRPTDRAVSEVLQRADERRAALVERSPQQTAYHR